MTDTSPLQKQLEQSVALEAARQVAPVQNEGAAILSIIERAARDPAVDIAKMERLFEMQERMMQRSAKEQFFAALSRLQKDLPTIARKGKGHNEKKYARFEDIIEDIRPVLSQHGFSLTYRVQQDDKTMTTTGVLGHEQGHSEQTEMRLPQDLSGNKNPVQAWGSSASYGKRYVTLTLLGIATEDEDDDGAGALRGNRKSSAASKRDGTDKRFNELVAMIRQSASVDDLREFTRNYQDEINQMPERWANIISDEWDLKRDELKAKGA